MTVMTMGKERRKFYAACLSCPHNIRTYGQCEKGYDNWYYRVSKKNGCSVCETAPQLSTGQITKIRKKKKASREEGQTGEPVGKPVSKAVTEPAGEPVSKSVSEPGKKEGKTSPNSYTIYTDGGCASNPGGTGGIGIVMISEDTGEIREISEGYTATTNNRMEMMAVIRAVEQTEPGDVLHILSDSAYVVNCITGQWEKKKNLDLWHRMAKACSGRKVGIKWIMGHSGIRENERCDELAACGMGTLNPVPDTGYDPGEYTFEPAGKQTSAAQALPKTGAMGIPIKIVEEPLQKDAEKRILELREKINPSCRKAIAGFNTSRKRFRDYAGIRTGGIDEVSGLSPDEIRSLIPDGERNAICMHFPADSDRMSCMRWRIRGLSPEDSIRKVLVDAEIRNNYLKSGKSY